MVVDANPRGRPVRMPPAVPSHRPLNLQALQTNLAPLSHLPLVFEYEGRAVRAGYHVTEIKSGSFASLDCGASPETWRETVIQLWDVEERGGARMSVAKFLAILGKVTSEIDFDQDARLTFELSDGEAAIRLYKAVAVDSRNGAARVTLDKLPASCKPRDRSLAASALERRGSCCGPVTGGEGRCA